MRGKICLGFSSTVRSVFIALATILSTVNCAILKNAYYLKDSANTQEADGHLLASVSWDKWSNFPYKIYHVSTYNTGDIIISAGFENLYYRYWATGIWIVPLAPLFGYREDQNMNTNRMVLALYSKLQGTMVFNPCDLSMSRGQKAVHFDMYHRDTVLKRIPCKDMTISDWTDAPRINVYFDLPITMEDLQVKLRNVKIDGRPIEVPEFFFKKDWAFIWTAFL